MKNRLVLIWLTLLTVGYFIAWTYTYDTDTPLGSDAPSVLDDRIRESKDATQERQNVDHYWPLTGSEVSDTDAGKHRKVTFLDLYAIGDTSPPAQLAGEAHLYVVSDELWWQDDTNTQIQLTDNGYIEYQSITDVNNNTYIKAVDAAGTGTVDLIKANASDVVVLPDGTQLATEPASTDDEKTIASIGYVKDKINTNYVSLADEKTADGDGGTFTSGAWRKRTVTEKTDSNSLCSVSSSVIVLSAGTYYCHIKCPAWRVDGHQARLQNTSAGTTLITGTTEYSENYVGRACQTSSVITGIFTVAASQNLEIQHRCATTQDTTGLGNAAGLGTEVYTTATFIKLGS